MEKIEKITMGISFVFFALAIIEVLNRQPWLSILLVGAGFLTRIIYRLYEKKKPEVKQGETLECSNIPK